MRSFQFTPKTDAELEALKNSHLLADGIYNFTVREVEQKISQTGNPMLKVTLGVTDSDNIRTIVDYLVSTEKMMFKLKHFCEALGLEKEYLAGSFDPDQCLDLTGSVHVSVQKGNLRPDGTGFYPDKNIARDYLKPIKSVTAEFNDDIKF
jgi:hypothetical protein